jgi:hypothetical protein
MTHLRAIESELASVGLTTRLHESSAGTDLTATLCQPGQREIEVVIDEDGYTELRYWASLGATPAQTVATITSALAAITLAQVSDAHIGPARQARVGLARYDGAVTERAGESGMPGPRDHAADQEQSPDPVRPREPDHPREAQAQSADLQGRLERLPVGHPSSPYRGDGSRKPSPPDLAQYEIPLPDELPSDPDQPDPHLPPDAAHTDPDGSWHWKARHLTPDQSRIGDEAAAECRDAEGRDAEGNYGDHGLTPAMRRIEAQLDHGHLVEDTEKFALKDPDRFKEKLYDLIHDEPDKSAEQHAGEIHDGIRYTFIFDPDRYVSSVRRTTEHLEANGFELGVIKNNWENEEFKGVNTRWLDEVSGKRFEVQYHTEESWQAKQTTHDAYRKINDLSVPTAEKERMHAYQREVSASVVLPPNWSEITDYRKEGW